MIRCTTRMHTLKDIGNYRDLGVGGTHNTEGQQAKEETSSTLLIYPNVLILSASVESSLKAEADR